MGWWVAEKGAPLVFPGHTEINEEAAKRVAIARSQENPGLIFQVRYHVNANAPTTVRWEALDGLVTEITGEDRKRP